MKKSGKGLSVPNGGAGGLAGVKKNKDMNAYATGGKVTPSNGIPSGPSTFTKGKARGGNAAVKGLGFTE